MKIISAILTIAVITTLSAAPKITKKQLVGNWHNGLDMGRENIEFAASGKYKRTYSEGEAPAEKGKWTLQQGKVTIKKANGKLVGKYVLIDSNAPEHEGKTILRKVGAQSCHDGEAPCWIKEE
jgi:uncharacterized membrane protein